MENHRFNGKTHYKWPFSIAMLNYQRVALYHRDRWAWEVLSSSSCRLWGTVVPCESCVHRTAVTAHCRKKRIWFTAVLWQFWWKNGGDMWWSWHLEIAPAISREDMENGEAFNDGDFSERMPWALLQPKPAWTADEPPGWKWDNPHLVGGSEHFFFHNIWDNPSHWLTFFKMVKTTNQTCVNGEIPIFHSEPFTLWDAVKLGGLDQWPGASGHFAVAWG